MDKLNLRGELEKLAVINWEGVSDSAIEKAEALHHGANVGKGAAGVLAGKAVYHKLVPAAAKTLATKGSAGAVASGGAGAAASAGKLAALKTGIAAGGKSAAIKAGAAGAGKLAAVKAGVIAGGKAVAGTVAGLHAVPLAVGVGAGLAARHVVKKMYHKGLNGKALGKKVAEKKKKDNAIIREAKEYKKSLKSDMEKHSLDKKASHFHVAKSIGRQIRDQGHGVSFTPAEHAMHLTGGLIILGAVLAHDAIKRQYKKKLIRQMEEHKKSLNIVGGKRPA